LEIEEFIFGDNLRKIIEPPLVNLHHVEKHRLSGTDCLAFIYHLVFLDLQLINFRRTLLRFPG